MIRPVNTSHASELCEIYNHYIKNTIITFEEKEVSVDDMKERIIQATQKLPWIVYIENDRVIGCAYASEWKSRCAYKFSVETTIYIHPEFGGKGIGSILYEELISKLKKLDLHAVIGGIAVPNEASVALHKKFGFEKVGQFKEVGFKLNKWIDVEYWELIF